jgi:hypothetical protein
MIWLQTVQGDSCFWRCWHEFHKLFTSHCVSHDFLNIQTQFSQHVDLSLEPFLRVVEHSSPMASNNSLIKGFQVFVQISPFNFSSLPRQPRMESSTFVKPLLVLLHSMTSASFMLVQSFSLLLNHEIAIFQLVEVTIQV